MNLENNQIKKLTIRLRASIFLVFILLFAGIVFIYSQYVKAVFPTKSSGSTLTADEWNSLPGDIGIPTNAVVAFNDAVCPLGWSPADGNAGTPDLRGAFIRGLNGDQNARDVVRALGNYQDDAFEAHTHVINAGAATDGGNIAEGGSTYTTGVTNSTGGAETRPKNVVLIYCVKN